MPKRIVFKIDNAPRAAGAVVPVNRVVCDLDLGEVIPQSILTLKEVYVRLNPRSVAGPAFVAYDYLNVQLTGIVGKNYIIDVDKGFNFLQIPLTKDREYNFDAPPVMTNVQWTWYSTNESFTMASQLQPSIEFAVFDELHQPVPPADLLLIMLVFEYSDPLTDRPAVVNNQGVQSLSRDFNRSSIF